MTQQGFPGLGYKQRRVGDDLDHQRNLSQAVKYFMLGGIKTSLCEARCGNPGRRKAKRISEKDRIRIQEKT